MPDRIYAVPGRTALYRFYDAEGVLLYAGISCELSYRMTHHAINQPWWPEVGLMTVEWYPDRPGAAAAEKAAIKSECPRHNVTHKAFAVTEPAGLAPAVIAAFHRMAEEGDGKPRTMHSMMVERFIGKYCPRPSGTVPLSTVAPMERFDKPVA